MYVSLVTDCQGGGTAPVIGNKIGYVPAITTYTADCREAG